MMHEVLDRVWRRHLIPSQMGYKHVMPPVTLQAVHTRGRAMITPLPQGYLLLNHRFNLHFYGAFLSTKIASIHTLGGE